MEPAARLAPLELIDRGELRRIGARALVAALPGEIAVRELDVVEQAPRLAAEAVAESSSFPIISGRATCAARGRD